MNVVRMQWIDADAQVLVLVIFSSLGADCAAVADGVSV